MTDPAGAGQRAPGADEQALVARLRAGDETAFRALVTRHHRAMLAVARLHVQTAAVAEEVVQETWLAVLQGLDRFEQRSTVRTWIFRILTNRAKTRGARERRTVPFSTLAEACEAIPSVEPDRFRDETNPWGGHWVVHPQPWAGLPEDRLLAGEVLATVTTAIDALPEAQRLVISFRDVEGWNAEEVCTALDITEVNQRVLLHRARSKVRAAIERHLEREVVR